MPYKPYRPAETHRTQDICVEARKKTDFDDLPNEVLDMIFQYSLCVDGEIVPYPKEWEKRDRGYVGIFKEEKPYLALLSLNKSISARAARILYGMNVWRLTYQHRSPTADRFWGTRLWTLNANSQVEWAGPGHEPLGKASLFRHILVRFHENDLDPVVKHCISKRCQNHNVINQDLDPGLPSENVHDVRARTLQDKWFDQIEQVAAMDLYTLILDVESVFCPAGCCRHESLLALFTRPMWSEMNVKKIVVTGILDRDELLITENSGIHSVVGPARLPRQMTRSWWLGVWELTTPARGQWLEEVAFGPRKVASRKVSTAQSAQRIIDSYVRLATEAYTHRQYPQTPGLV